MKSSLLSAISAVKVLPMSEITIGLFFSPPGESIQTVSGDTYYRAKKVTAAFSNTAKEPIKEAGSTFSESCED